MALAEAIADESYCAPSDELMADVPTLALSFFSLLEAMPTPIETQSGESPRRRNHNPYTSRENRPRRNRPPRARFHNQSTQSAAMVAHHRSLP